MSSTTSTGGLAVLLLVAVCLHPVNANLKRPTLVGIGQCETLPTVRLPLYWSKLYAPDGKDHHGPKDILSIISDGITVTSDEQHGTDVSSNPTPPSDPDQVDEVKLKDQTDLEVSRGDEAKQKDADADADVSEIGKVENDSGVEKGADEKTENVDAPQESNGKKGEKGEKVEEEMETVDKTDKADKADPPKDVKEKEKAESDTQKETDGKTEKDAAQENDTKELAKDESTSDEGRKQGPSVDEKTGGTDDKKAHEKTNKDDTKNGVKGDSEEHPAKDSSSESVADKVEATDASSEKVDPDSDEKDGPPGKESDSEAVDGTKGENASKNQTAADIPGKKQDESNKGDRTSGAKKAAAPPAVRTFPKKQPTPKNNRGAKGPDRGSTTQYTVPTKKGGAKRRTMLSDGNETQSGADANSTSTKVGEDKDEGSFGWTAQDGTVRVSIDDVTQGARVKVIVFYYADLRQCSVLATDLSALIDEVNAEVAANDNLKHLGDHAVAAVAINHHWPITCDQYPGKCNVTTDAATLQESQWQGKLTSAAPKLPILQDTARVDAFDAVFGTYYTDVLVYVDDRVYQYFPSALAIAHSKVLAAHVDEAHKEILNDWKRFKSVLLEAVQIPFVWCEGGQTNVATPDETLGAADKSFIASKYDYDQRRNDTSSLLDNIPIDNYVDPDSDLYEIVLGFVLAAIATFGTLLICLIWKCCFSWAEYCCCDLPIHKHRKMGLEYDGLGEFRPLSGGGSTANDGMGNDDDWSDGDDEYSHYLEGVEADGDKLEYGLSPDLTDEEAPQTIERLSDPQSVAEAFFRRQEEVELEMRAFRQEAHNDKILQSNESGMSLDHPDDNDESEGQDSPIFINGAGGQLDLEREMERQEQELLEQEEELNESLGEEEDDGTEEYEEDADDDDDDDDDLFQEFQDRPQLGDEEGSGDGFGSEQASAAELASDASSNHTGDRDDEMSETSGLDLEVLERKITKSVVEQEQQERQQNEHEREHKDKTEPEQLLLAIE